MKQRIGIVLLVITVLSVLRIAPAQAQSNGWPEPYRLSSDQGKASESYLVADQYGFVHCFWVEALFSSGRSVIRYARFDGATWTKPNDIYITDGEIDENMSSVVDKNGMLHLIWTQSSTGPVYYTYAPAYDALSAQNWATPRRIEVPAGVARLQVDSKGVFHILYTKRTPQLGVYYVRSRDNGETWSEPLWLDPDILPDHTPDSLYFQLDENDGLHAVWFYGALEQDGHPDWVRYIHSLDGGDTWSEPFLIDQYDEATEHNLTSAGPIMIVQGQTVHVIWAAGSLPYRNHRYSTDAGRTWSAPQRILGELHGQAGDNLAVDANGEVYFFAQIRYPIAIYESHWEQPRWSRPTLVYPIAEEGEDMGDRIHAHRIHAVVRAGNQLVITFGDPPTEPGRRLFTTYRTLDNVAPVQTLPTPTAVTSLLASPTPEQATPVATAAASIKDPGDQRSGEAPPADFALRIALVPTLLFLAGIIVLRSRQKHKP